MMTHDIEETFKTTERIITDVHQSSVIQDNLNLSNQRMEGIKESIPNFNAMRKELYWLLANQIYILNTIIVDNYQNVMVGSVYDKEHYFQGMSLDEMLSMISKKYNQEIWFFDKDLNKAIYIKNIYGTRDNSMSRIGIAVVEVNTRFIQETFDSTGIFNKDDFFVLEKNGEFYTTDLEGYGTYVDFINKNLTATDMINSYTFHNVNNKNYYMQRTKLYIGGNELQCFYFLVNNQLIKNVLQITFLLLIIIITLMIIGIRGSNHYLKSLIEPINKLASSMNDFTNKHDFDNFKKIQDPDIAFGRDDEVGVLYNSFHSLIHHIDELVINDYKSKLLSQEMEYKFLQSQLNPHFLYNTLNSMNFMALRKGETELSDMITALALLLREKLDDKKKVETIQEELDIIQAYIKIQKLRFKSRMVFESWIQEETRIFKIPRLIIQPLIENSIKYGVEKVNRPMHIGLEIFFTDKHLYIRVMDDGPGFGNSSATVNSRSTGVGLKNIEKRLFAIYGKEAKMTIDSIQDEKTVVIIEIPRDSDIKKWEGENENEEI
ncbi:MAG: sensor histidine kinase [Suipraeoptans sp.]